MCRAVATLSTMGAELVGISLYFGEAILGDIGDNLILYCSCHENDILLSRLRHYAANGNIKNGIALPVARFEFKAVAVKLPQAFI